eukprot:g62204.t1
MEPIFSLSMSLLFICGISAAETLTEDTWQMVAHERAIKSKLRFRRSVDPALGSSRAQSLEDQTAWNDFFCGLNEGIVLESGALDGLTFSNTYALVHSHNWSAVHIEANPTEYTKLIQNRPESTNVHAAICMSPQEVHYINTNLPAVHGIMEFMSPQFLRLWHKHYTNRNFSGVPVVNCIPLGWILKKLNLHHINWWILDVEGGELQVLNAVSFSKVMFDVITIEFDGGDPDKETKIITLLHQHGYYRALPKHAKIAYQPLFIFPKGKELSRARVTVTALHSYFHPSQKKKATQTRVTVTALQSSDHLS